MIPRLFVSTDLHAGQTVNGSANQAHYLKNVLRHAPGDAVCLFNGQDGEFAAHIADLRKTTVTFRVTTQTRPQAPEAGVWLAFCLLKRDATDLVVQKATELAVSAILPILSNRTNAVSANLDRLRAIATEAAEQSERLTVPVLHAPQTLAALLAKWPPDRTLAAAIERTEAAAPHGQGGLLVGPEGGFSAGELDALRAAPFIQAVSLGPRILRAETAAIAGLALLLARRSW
jgi:16S rRNA (uracil1498-N3)-methyltransferase